MRTNESKWKQWYRQNLGKEWSDERETRPDLSTLSPRQIETGTLLYERYLTEKVGANARQFALQSVDHDAANSRQLARIAAQIQQQYTPQTARKAGLQGTDYSTRLQEQAERNAQWNMRQAQLDAQSARQKVLEYYDAGRRKQDTQLAQDLASVDKRYDAIDKENWSKLQAEWRRELKAMTLPNNDKVYTDEGVAALARQAETHREELGSYYAQAVEWLNQLPTESNTQRKIILYSADGNEHKISWQDWQNATKVRNVNSHVDLDGFTLLYQNKVYSLCAGDAVDEEQNQFFNALAKSKQLPSTAGTLLYWQQHLYVYDKEGQWHQVRTLASRDKGSVEQLVVALRTTMQQ